jgi:hypothetical protein
MRKFVIRVYSSPLAAVLLELAFLPVAKEK